MTWASIMKEGKTYIRLGAQAYEQSFDGVVATMADQAPNRSGLPALSANGHGAWQHTLERLLSGTV